MSKVDSLYDFFTDLANAIRAKEGSTAKISPQDMAVRIAALDDKVVMRKTRTTLIELLQDIAEALRLIEGTTALINPQDMASRVLAFIKEYYINVTEGAIWLNESNGYSQDIEVMSNTVWTIEY